MRSFIFSSAVAVGLSVGMAGCASVDKPVANPYLPDAITSSLGSTVEYNKLCQSDALKAPSSCRRAKVVVMDADRAARPVTRLNASGEEVKAPKD